MRLPLASFDALLRVVGPLLPFLALAARMAVQIWIGAQQDHWRGWAEAGLVYAAVTVSRGAIYLTHRAGGCSLVAPFTCGQEWPTGLGHADASASVQVHCLLLGQGSAGAPYRTAQLSRLCWRCFLAGIFQALTSAGAISATPAHLMSDHVFLGASVQALMACELLQLSTSLWCVCQQSQTAMLGLCQAVTGCTSGSALCVPCQTRAAALQGGATPQADSGS